MNAFGRDRIRWSGESGECGGVVSGESGGVVRGGVVRVVRVVVW